MATKKTDSDSDLAATAAAAEKKAADLAAENAALKAEMEKLTQARREAEAGLRAVETSADAATKATQALERKVEQLTEQLGRAQDREETFAAMRAQLTDLQGRLNKQEGMASAHLDPLYADNEAWVIKETIGGIEYQLTRDEALLVLTPNGQEVSIQDVRGDSIVLPSSRFKATDEDGNPLPDIFVLTSKKRFPGWRTYHPTNVFREYKGPRPRRGQFRIVAANAPMPRIN